MLLLVPGRFGWLVVSTGVMISSRPGLCLRAMFGSMTLLYPGSVLVSVAPETIEDHADVRGLGCYGAMLLLGPCWSGRPVL